MLRVTLSVAGLDREGSLQLNVGRDGAVLADWLPTPLLPVCFLFPWWSYAVRGMGWDS